MESNFDQDIPVEEPEMVPVTPVKTGKTTSEKRDRVARCLTCSNEWVAHNGNEKKPSRCPACKSRVVAWRDECKDEAEPQYEITYAVNSQDAGKPIFHEEPEKTPVEKKKTGKPGKKSAKPEPKPELDEDYREEVSVEEIRSGLPQIPMQTVVIVAGIIAALGVIVFLARKGRANREARIREMQMQAQPEPQYSGTAAAILRQRGIIGRT